MVRRSRCLKVHRPRCDMPSWMEKLAPVYPDWLIDVDQVRLVPFDSERTTYFAVSIIKLLGERYIWIDSLCIVQDDEQVVDRTLSQMHMVHATSVLCLVAKAGQDCKLRASRHPMDSRDARHDGEKLTGGYHCHYPPKFAVTGCSYDERAWTFQDFMFSRRRLIFYHGPLSWFCQSDG